jgi:hypothetical protein
LPQDCRSSLSDLRSRLVLSWGLSRE